MGDRFASPQGQAPPGEPQSSCSTQAEFVICDCTIEESFRFQKSELQIESLRLRDWEPRRKMLLLVTLAYGFLLALLAPSLFLARSRLLVGWCQRADWRLWTAKVPVYRLRWALSQLWHTHPPRFARWQPYRPLSHITWPVCSLPWWTTLWHQCGYVF
ncbi:MAG TPA: hypothetical protein VFK47_23275 [Ktedonobacteraceae bacterium]|nr:hypothetical protein [Ktedonobacteraceae bacterium]